MRDLTYPPIIVTAKVAFRALGQHFSLTGTEHVPRTGGVLLACNHIGYVDFVYGGLAANPSGRIADLRRSRRSASDSLRQYRADWLFGAVRWIDAGADYIIEHPPPKCLGHDADEGRAVSCASYVRSNPGELVEVVPYDPRTVVQSQVLRHPGRDRYREARVIVTRRYRRGDDA